MDRRLIGIQSGKTPGLSPGGFYLWRRAQTRGGVSGRARTSEAIPRKAAATALPIAALTGVILSFGRISSDGELTAMKASGTS